MDQARIDSYRSAAELAADEQRGIQKRIDELDANRKDANSGKGSPQHPDAGAKKGKSAQDGARKQPANPLPQQHQENQAMNRSCDRRRTTRRRNTSAAKNSREKSR